MLILLISFLLISKSLNKNNFNQKEFFQNIYTELYHKVINYGEEYLTKNNIKNADRIDIRELIDKINADSVFLLSCKGYITVNDSKIKPYINCNNVIVTEGYIDK